MVHTGYMNTTQRVTEVQASGTIGTWTANEGEWYKVQRRNKRSLTIKTAPGYIVTLPREMVTGEKFDTPAELTEFEKMVAASKAANARVF